MTKIQNNDFIEIEFTGRVKDGEVFDSNIKEDLEKINPQIKAKPFIFCLGHQMFLKGIEEFLIGKDLGKYEVELEPEKAFGKRQSNLVQMIPLRIFKEKQVNPIPGAMLNFDGKPGKILTVSGGRVMVDFNNPLAGKNVIYNIEAKRIVKDQKEQIDSFNEFLFKKTFPFETQDKKLILKVDKQLAKFVEMFKEKYKEIFGLELEVKELEEK